MEQPPQQGSIATPQNTYVVVLRARSSARFKPEHTFEIFFNDVPGCSGPVRFRMRTRWVDEGHEAAIPRELWIEARGPAPSLDHATSKFAPAGRFFSVLLSFTANVPVDVPEVHVAYDATPGSTEREFVEVFIPDEKGHPREGRIARPDEFATLFAALQGSGDISRLNRAINQYGLALRYWYFGGEWLALSHLYMAVETLTDAALAYICRKDRADEQELARRNGVDITDKSTWRHKLLVWTRKNVIFGGDNSTYRAARHASDGVEHGFLELDEVHRNALVATEATFGYVRRMILNILSVSSSDFPELYERTPRDVQSLRKMVRGHFVGDGSDPAPANEEYPRLEWNSSVKTWKRDGDKYLLSFQEKFTIRCAGAYGFRGSRFEARGRTEPGWEPVKLDAVVETSKTATTTDTSRGALALMQRTTVLASAAAAHGQSVGIPAHMLNVFGLFSEQVALFEAIEVLLRDNRPIEAMVLLRSLMLGTCRLESIAEHPNCEGAAVRVRIEAIDRQIALYGTDPDIVRIMQAQVARYRGDVTEKGIVIPDVAPDIRETRFYAENGNSLQFLEEVALSDELAIDLHMVKDNEGNQAMSTRIVDAKLLCGVAGDAVAALTAATIALSKAFGWPYSETASAEIAAEAKRISEGE